MKTEACRPSGLDCKSAFCPGLTPLGCACFGLRASSSQTL